MLDELMQERKHKAQEKPAAEVGIITSINPHLKFKINGQEYSSEHFTVYVPAVYRIKQFEKIDVETPDHVIGEAYVDIGDLELIPDLYEKPLEVGDLVSVTDRGNSFIIHNRLVKWGDTTVLYPPRH